MNQLNILKKDFLIPTFSLKMKSIMIKWEIFHNFEEPDQTNLEKKFNISITPQKVLNELPENPSSLKKVLNPYPIINFEEENGEMKIDIPVSRILTAGLTKNELIVVFLPHGSSAITGFKIDKPVAWCRANIRDSNDKLQELQQKLNSMLFINGKIPRPRCPNCQGLTVLKNFSEKEKDNSELVLKKSDFICLDCMHGAFKLYNSLKESVEEERKNNNWVENSEILEDLISGGISLADDLDDQKMLFEFLIFRVELLINLHQQVNFTEIKELINQIHMFATTWNFDNLEQKILKFQKQFEEIEEQQSEIKEKVLDTEELLVQDAIKLLENAKIFEKEEKYQEAIDAIYKAANPLVEHDIWGEEELIAAQSEVARLKDLLSLKPPAPPKIEEPPAPPKIEETPRSIKVPNLPRVKLPSLSKPLKDHIINEEEEDQNKLNLEFTPPNEIPIDKEAQALGETLEFEQTEKMENKIKTPKLSFIPPDEIPIDKEAQALGEALEFKPPEEKNLHNNNPKLTFIPPDEIPIDEEAQELGNALEFKPKETNNVDTKSDQIKENKVQEKKNGFREISPASNFFGVERDILEEKRMEEKKPTSEIFNYFSPKPIGNKKSKIQSEIHEKISTDQINNTNLADLAKRRREIHRKSKGNRKRVELCPMCGEIAKNCKCGYMKNRK